MENILCAFRLPAGGMNPARAGARLRAADRPGRLRRIVYAERIRKRGWLGIPYTAVKLRTAHVDERRWRRLRGRPFSIQALMCVDFMRED